MKRRVAKALVGLLVVFAVCIPLYYAFSHGKNDALEQSLQEGNATEGESPWTAPLTYGDTPFETFLAGITGLSAVLLISYSILHVIGRKRRYHGPNARDVAPPRS